MTQRNPLFKRNSPKGGGSDPRRVLWGDGASTTGEVFIPTHTVPAWGLEMWNTPDMAHDPADMIAPGTQVQVLERRANGVVRLQAPGRSPGWTDGRQLQEIPGSAPADSTADFTQPLKAALATSSRLLQEFKTGRIDADSFRVQAFRAGLVVLDEEAWMWDFRSGWFRYDGIVLSHMALPAEGRDGNERNEERL
ncbi:hypothetical protein NGB36_12095 [Streptomyces sp. RB6PN25]|uniref:Uncharacterized protein n=1 Tax=Streptomyces humicola TaxID=2953240 RepID=A0ABT1PXP2_9ACTN|nr:hypothetical protein [Streptomyces humicola]MCQ4081322.1 hypothetical protein [Streptomyces humicola]